MLAPPRMRGQGMFCLSAYQFGNAACYMIRTDVHTYLHTYIPVHSYLMTFLSSSVYCVGLIFSFPVLYSPHSSRSCLGASFEGQTLQ